MTAPPCPANCQCGKHLSVAWHNLDEPCPWGALRALEAELAKERERHRGESCWLADEQRARAEAAEAREARLREVLEKYGHHIDACRMLMFGKDPCGCGFIAALTRKAPAGGTGVGTAEPHNGTREPATPPNPAPALKEGK